MDGAIADNNKNIMSKYINFEDTIFILNVRIRMIHDLLRLDTDCGLFLCKTMEDLAFIGSALEMLTDKLTTNPGFVDRELEADNLSDIEWQFSQLLNEYSGNSSPFSIARFPETAEQVCRLREESEKRRRFLEVSFVSPEHSQTESVVTQAELSELLRGI